MLSESFNRECAVGSSRQSRLLGLLLLESLDDISSGHQVSSSNRSRWLKDQTQRIAVGVAVFRHRFND